MISSRSGSTSSSIGWTRWMLLIGANRPRQRQAACPAAPIRLRNARSLRSEQQRRLFKIAITLFTIGPLVIKWFYTQIKAMKTGCRRDR